MMITGGMLFGIPSDEAMNHFNEKNTKQGSSSPYEAEQYDIDERDAHPDKLDRDVFGFGQKCPLPLKDGIKECKACLSKVWDCKSMVCKDFAQNYLAHHAFNSSNHLQNNVNDAFEEAV